MNGSQLEPWRRAHARYIADLTDAEKILFKDATLENIFYSASAAQKLDEESNSFRAALKSLEPLCESISQYGRALDIYSSTKSQILGPIWGSIRVLIYIAREYNKYFERLIAMLGQIGDILPRFRDYEQLFPSHRRLLYCISDAYLDIITFCEKAKSIFKKNQKWKRSWLPGSVTILRVTWRPFDREFGDILGNIRHHRDLVDREADVSQMWLAKSNMDLAKRIRKDVKRQRLLKRLSTVDYFKRFKSSQKQRYEGTGAWVMDSSEFNSWFEATTSSGLWCHGIPGCGKTTATSGVINFLLSNTADQNSGVSYIYCDYQEAESLKASAIIGTLVRQLLSRWMDIPIDIENRMEEIVDRHPDCEDMLGLLVIMAKKFSTLYIVIDGIDECDPEQRAEVLTAFTELLNLGQPVVKIFTSSRMTEDIQHACENYGLIRFTEQTIAPDISRVVRETVRSKLNSGHLKLRNSDLAELIISKLIDGAGGMFLWVAFQLQDILAAISDDEIREVLNNLPKNLLETYERILKKIIASGRASLIQTIFRRIICAKRPLTIDELLEAITINSQDRTFPLARIPTHGLRVVQACLNLVVLDDDDTVRLAHQTIQQFLCTLPEPSAFRCDFAQANKELGELCVAYLAFSDFETQLVRQDQTMEILASAIYSCHPLQAQTAAATRLYKRVRRGQNKQKPYYDFNHMRRLSSSPSIEIRRKYRLLDYIREYWFFHTLDLAPDNTALWVTFKNLLLYKTFPFAFKPWGKTVSTGKVPFLWAIHTGHATAFQHLFGPDHMRRCYLEHSDEHQECYETRLRLFSMPYFTRPDVVLFFLTILVTYRERADYLKNHFQHDSNANVGEVLSTLATRNDSSDLVKTIFNDWDDSDLSPLHRAARMGHMAILQKLLELGGNTQVTGRLGQTPLHDANDQEVAWILLFYGAESNASTPHGESPLHDAVFHSRHTVVRELLWQGANPNGTTIDGETPLHYALSGGDSGVISPRLGERSHGSFYSRIEVIKELLVHGADPNSIDSFGQSPLHWASRAGSVKIANMLREYGANDEVTATSGETPLYAARL